MLNPKPFWMVQGAGPAIVRHPTKAIAVAEARRLARENPGSTFYVMQAVKAFARIDVMEVDLDPDFADIDGSDDEIPF